MTDQPKTGKGVIAARLTKTFGGSRALRDVAVEFRAGEIHGVVGQNGAGKSTLFKILAGAYAPDDGSTLQVDGDAVDLPLNPAQSASLGFSFVHQDLGLADTLSVSENVCVGGFVTGAGGRILWSKQAALVRRLLSEFDLHVSPSTPISQLSQAEKAMVAITRGLYARGASAARMLVLDEPTAYLAPPERARLFKAMRRAAELGVAVIFCTHHIDEIQEITDCVTVLRDGKVVASGPTRELGDERKLVELILGRPLSGFYPPKRETSEQVVVLESRRLSGGPIREASLSVNRGEVVGVTGLTGGGHDVLPYLLVGATRITDGEVLVHGQQVKRINPHRAVKLGVGLLPANRGRDSGIGVASLRENLTMVSMGDFTRFGRIRQEQEKRGSVEQLERFQVRPSGNAERALSSLSGGNQQKVLIAKWMAMHPLDCMILHEPTQGVDVGASEAILEIIVGMTQRGTGVLLVSTEYEHLSHLCDRVLVMRSGRIVTELHGPSAAQIEECCYTPGERQAAADIYAESS